jgi:hypothetical protein
MTPNEYSVQLEALRRERTSIDAGPLPTVLVDEKMQRIRESQIRRHGEIPVIDVSEAGLLIDVSTHHLRESIINGQKARTKLAQEILERGVAAQRAWLELKGYMD